MKPVESSRSAPRILHVVTVDQTLGFLRGQAAFMKANGLAVFAASSPGELAREFASSECISVAHIPMTRRISPLRDLRSLWQLARLVRGLRPEIVHAHTPKAALLAMLAAGLCHVPVRIYHIHGLPLMTAKGVRRIILEATERFSCRIATHILCVSHSIRKEVEQRRLSGGKTVHVLSGGSINGVDATIKFNPARHAASRLPVRSAHQIPPDAFVLGFVGRLVRDKGIVELAEAWTVLANRYPHLHMLLVGPFEAEDPVPDEVRHNLTEDPRVHFHGSDWNTPPLYAAMDVLVLPTYREGFPVVPLEAAAMGIPVIATSVPGCVDAVIHDQTGILIPPYKSQEIVLAVERYLRNAAERGAHGGAARSRVLRDFDQGRIWNALLAFYAAALSQHGVALREVER